MSVMAAALLGLGVLLASAVPFVPTGEVVSAASALASGSVPDLLLVYVVVVAGSLVGDTLLLLATGLVARRVTARQRAWLQARKLAPAVHRARTAIGSHVAQSVVVGRLVPGSRAPVIIALGVDAHPVRQFVSADAVACSVWAAIYVVLGAVGGRASGHPVIGTVVAVACAVVLGLAIGRVSAIRERRAAAREQASVSVGGV